MSMYQKLLIPTLLALAIAPPAFGAPSKNKSGAPMQVLDQGLDEDQRIYSVACPDGSRGSVSQFFTFTPETKVIKVCAYSATNDAVCKPQWNVDDAAKTLCK